MLFYMTSLLQSVNFKFASPFDYQVEKNGDIYGVRVNHCSIFDGEAIYGNLSLDKLIKKPSFVWTPKLSNPFSTEKCLKISRQSEIFISDVMLSHYCWKKISSDGFNQFINRVSAKILQSYRARANKEDLELFFEKTYKHYLDYF